MNITVFHDDVFKGNDVIEKVEIPGSISRIAPFSFYNSKKLKRMLINEGTKKIMGSAFKGRESLTDRTEKQEEIVTEFEAKVLEVVNATVTDETITDLNDTLIEYDIITPDRIAHFLGQCTKESGQGKWAGELYNGDPIKYFTDMYEDREDLGNNQPGDRYKFRGAGYIQVTGRDNYQAFANSFDDESIKEKIMSGGADYVKEHYPWRASGFWWNDNGINAIIDGGASVKEITLRVNYNLKYQPDYEKQIERRTEYTNQALEILIR